MNTLEKQKQRIYPLNNVQEKEGNGPVVYWMSRDQRVKDNWALYFAQEEALKRGVGFEVVFCLNKGFLNATPRHYTFMLQGLQEVEKDLKEYNIPFIIVKGDPVKSIVQYVKEKEACMLFTDFSPLHISREWKEGVAVKLKIPFYEVDAHNIIPARTLSDKQEFAAYTIRPKIYKIIEEYSELPPKPKVHKSNKKWKMVDWDDVFTVKETIDWILPGEKSAHKALQSFLKEENIHHYATERNDPNKNAQSNLSPFIHFGQIYAGRIAFEVVKQSGIPLLKLLHKEKNGAGEDDGYGAFLEELIVRRELAENFCLYNAKYDSCEGFPDWAKKSLDKTRKDKREFVYTQGEFEKGKTHDDLWNACQMEMVNTGKMHGYMRMYWAKKILEWTKSPEDAMKIAIYLNDTYELDGRDPNGYAGIAWSIGGVHDRAWFERPIFGQIRYMNRNGCKAKFDIESYIEKQKGNLSN